MRKFRVVVNGTTYEVDIEEITDSDSLKAGPSHAPAVTAADVSAAPSVPPRKPAASSVVGNGGANNVIAQMPGTIVAVNVSPGDQVERGEPLVILEAMKMENEVVAPRDGRVLEIKVEKDGSVNAGDVLVILE